MHFRFLSLISQMSCFLSAWEDRFYKPSCPCGRWLSNTRSSHPLLLVNCSCLYFKQVFPLKHISFLPFSRTALKPISLLPPKASLSLLSWIISISILTSCYSPILNIHTASLVPISPFSCFQKAQKIVTMPKIKFLVFTAKTDLPLSSSPPLTVTASSLCSFSD